MEGFDLGNWLGGSGEGDAKFNICKRCGAAYPLSAEHCPQCIHLSEEQAHTKKLKLINARADRNRNLSRIIISLLVVVLLLITIMWLNT